MNNSENVFNMAEAQLEKPDQDTLRTNELLKLRAKLVEPINRAVDTIPPEGKTEIAYYAASEDRNLDLIITQNQSESGPRRRIVDILIEGRLVTESNSARMPMYKISKAELHTDGGRLNDHYVVSVANSEGEYQPIALIEQTILHEGADNYKIQGSVRIDYDIFKAHDQLTALDMQELKKTGIWTDPRAIDQLAEVQDILGLVISQEQAAA